MQQSLFPLDRAAKLILAGVGDASRISRQAPFPRNSLRPKYQMLRIGATMDYMYDWAA